MNSDRCPTVVRARARRAYEIARLCESWPLLVAAVALSVLGVALGAPMRHSMSAGAVLAGFCVASQWWRTPAGTGCACGLIGGGAWLIMLGTAGACGMDGVVTAREAALAPACVVVTLLAIAAAVRPRHWSYWSAAIVAFSLVQLLVACVVGGA